MKLSNELSDEDLMADCEREMRLNLAHAKNCFALAKGWFDQLDAPDEQKVELWNRFAAFERAIMKGDREWS